MSPDPARRVELADLTGRLPLSGDGVHWTLASSEDLNANLVHLDPDHEIGAHVNDAVDVLVVVLAGDGTVEVDGAILDLAAGVTAHLPRGSRRTIRSASDGMSYLTVHRRRGGLGIGPRRS